MNSFLQEVWSMLKLLLVNIIVLTIVALLGSTGAWGFLCLANPIKFMTIFSYVGAAVCFVYCLGITWEHSKKG